MGKRSISTVVIFSVLAVMTVMLLFSATVYSKSTLKASTKTKRYTVALFPTRSEKDQFWASLSGFMEEAANQLGMDLDVYYANNDYILGTKYVQAAINKKNDTDMLVIVDAKKQLSRRLAIAESAKVPAIVFNQGFVPKDNAGLPRQKNKYWIGNVLPDDQYAGELLAKELIKHAKPGSDKKIHMLAVRGFLSDYASIERLKGLKKAVAQNKNVELVGISQGDWTKAPAKKTFMGLKKRFPEVTVVWAANDNMAMGVIEGIKEMGLKPGKDVIVGGIDWTDEAIVAIQKGELDTSVGGHFMDSAWAAVMAYDYLNGKDFSSESTQVFTKMAAINKYNYKNYSKVLNKSNWKKINFRKYSKVLNPSVKKYQFGINTVIEQL
jgi:ABC-type sugar transport system substrate-binding protein